MFYSVAKSEDLNLRHSISGKAEKLFQRGRWGSQDIEEFLQQNQVVGTSKDYC